MLNLPKHVHWKSWCEFSTNDIATLELEYFYFSPDYLQSAQMVHQRARVQHVGVARIIRTA